MKPDDSATYPGGFIPLRVRHAIEVSRVPALTGMAQLYAQLSTSLRRRRLPVLAEAAVAEPVRPAP